MREKKIAQNELARRINMSSSGISTALADNANPRLETIKAISSALNCRIADLVDETEPSSQTLTPDELRLLNLYNLLNESGKQVLIHAALNLVQTPELRQDGSIASMG
jgi:transcriptional regulator with XRE-family HTH domain